MEKISYLCLHLGHGGIERSTITQANILADDFEVELNVVYKLNETIPFHLDDRVKVNYLTRFVPNRKEFKLAIKNKNPLQIIREGFYAVKVLFFKKRSVKQFYKNTDADIIVSTAMYFSLLKKQHCNDKVTIAQEHVDHKNNEKYLNKIKNIMQYFDYLMPISNFLVNDYKKFESENTKCKVLDVKFYLDIDIKKDLIKKKKLVCVGRLSQEKGHLDLIEVFNEFNKLDSTYELHIIGDGDQRLLIEEKIKKYQLNNVVMHGYLSQDEVFKEYEDASVFLLTSFEESFGIVILEANAYGIPVIAFDSANGAKEIITDNYDGILIGSRDIKGMASRLYYLLSNQDNLETFSANAYSKADLYSSEDLKSSFVNEFKEIIKK